MNFRVTPKEFLDEIGWRYKSRGNWLTPRVCPFCSGGERGSDLFTFAVHSIDGNYFCHRAKCGVRGTFWGLIESQGKDVKDYFGESEIKPHRTTAAKKQHFVYGRENNPTAVSKGKKRFVYGR